MQVLNEAVAESAVPRLEKSYRTTRQHLMLTLLFMNIFGVQRPWDLRSYTGDGLALLSGRQSAYGYAHTERFLTQIAQSGVAERLTTSMAQWTSQLWSAGATAVYYVDGHKKPVVRRDNQHDIPSKAGEIKETFLSQPAYLYSARGRTALLG